MPVMVDGQIVHGFLLALPRLAGMTLLLPFYRAPGVPPLVRNVILLTLALVILPVTMEAAATVSFAGGGLVFLILKEVGVGMVIGILVGLAFLAPQIVGDYLDNQRGASIASLFNPAIGGQSSNLGLLLSQAFIVWFIVAGGMDRLHGLLLESYRVYPIAAMLPVPGPEAVDGLMGILSAVLKLALLLAAPAAFTMLLAELGLGLVSRFAPQLNVFFLAMPLKSVVALTVVGLSFWTVMEHVWTSGLIFEPLEGLFDGLEGDRP